MYRAIPEFMGLGETRYPDERKRKEINQSKFSLHQNDSDARQKHKQNTVHMFIVLERINLALF